MGRHAAQHFTSLLSAHVWVPGWLASYYLAGNHRGLDVAEQTGDFYLRKSFGDHDLRGRRLYLSIWNLAELYDADKKQKYLDDLKDRVSILLELQRTANRAAAWSLKDMDIHRCISHRAYINTTSYPETPR